MVNWTIEPIRNEDKDEVIRLMIQNWGSEVMVVHGESFHLADQPGFLARDKNRILGLLTYRIDRNSDGEVLSLDSFMENMGVGTALLERFLQQAEDLGLKHVYLTTTNDNIRALQFYQKRGFTLCGFRRNAVLKARQVKPEIPLVAENGIPIEHELELEYVFEANQSKNNQNG
ncbi:GNAT family N-acetyltransferase [Sporolactobacillus vineae]|uniref:GNAT family N-acetyltransferase n=1 Tax=Sporolactobacillus vineae TaxID=444463 RepID=UPI000288ACD6|nr:GNAT family N-acetyltransferase [Sporolactobacillus vineae]